MNLDPAARAAIAWKVVAASVNALGDDFPAWADVGAEAKSFVTRAVEAIDTGDTTGEGLAVAMSMAGWTMGRWNQEERHCVLAVTRQGPGLVAWAAAVAALEALKEI